MRRAAEVRVDGHKWFVGKIQVGWEDEKGFNFHLENVQWVNVFGRILGDVKLDFRYGKIIGDE